MDPDSELQFDFSPFVRLYKSGRVERLITTSFVPASPVDPDPATGVLSKDVPIDPDRGVSARLYLPAGDGAAAAEAAKLPIVLYFHGGAFCVESAFSPLYHGYLNSLVARARVVAVSLEYRLAPEHPLPAAYDDAWAALEWAASGPEPWLAGRGDLRRVFLAGDSAGANIAHATAMRATKEADLGFGVKGLVLLNPYFAGGEEPRDAGARARMESAWRFVCAGRYGVEHPHANPAGWPEQLKELACERVLVAVAERDHLRERGSRTRRVCGGAAGLGRWSSTTPRGRTTSTSSSSPTATELRI
uniref:Alpha/beta hydrolase fold-3 domain-containing protein n=1 Tax=Ananas comosus var. bracteatus TaxID=296719 RepID=A0A6V7P6F3_ANACO|nr:unnamed protein product [Ananas comosus var. bracteatus]